MFSWGSSWGYFKGVENFSEVVKDFWRDWEFFMCRVEVFFMMVEAFLGGWNFYKEKCFSCRLGFFGGGRLIFFQRLKVFSGIKIIPSELSFLSGCLRFSRGLEVKFFFSDGGSGFFWRIHLKISIFSWQSFNHVYSKTH